MKRTALLGALLVAVIACSMAISTPQPAQALRCCDAGAYATGHYWVMKNSCSEAATEFRNIAMPEAQATCNPEFVCQTELPPCYYDAASKMYVIDGPMFFGCTYRCDIEP